MFQWTAATTSWLTTVLTTPETSQWRWWLITDHSEPQQINVPMFRVGPCSSTARVERLKIIQTRIKLRSGRYNEELNCNTSYVKPPGRCDAGEGSRFQVITTAGAAEDNFSNLGCEKQYKEYFNKTGQQCGPNDEGELVEVEEGGRRGGQIYILRIRSASRQRKMGSFTGCSQVVTTNSRQGWIRESVVLERPCQFPWRFNSTLTVKAHNLWVYHHVLGSVGSNDNNNDRYFPNFLIVELNIL